MKTYAEKIIKRAQLRGSTATTARGAAKWLLNNLPVYPDLPIPTACDQQACHCSDLLIYFLAHKKLDGAKIGDKIELDSGVNYGYRFRSLVDSGAAARAEKSIGRGGQKSNYGPGFAQIFGAAHQACWEIINYRGAYKGYSGRFLRWNYQSCVGISPSGKTAIILRECVLQRRLRAPAGLVFDCDDNGIFLRRLSDGMDFHPTHAHFYAKNFAGIVRGEMAKNFKARLALKKSEKQAANVAKIFAREIAGTRVNLLDSRRAGNCVEGSLNFAERRLGISRQEILDGGHLFSVPAEKLLKTGDVRAINAVKIAWLRETTVAI